MARIYSPVGPSDNKAVLPGKEKKAGKPSGTAPGKGGGKGGTPDKSGQGDTENTGKKDEGGEK